MINVNNSIIDYLKNKGKININNIDYVDKFGGFIN